MELFCVQALCETEVQISTSYKKEKCFYHFQISAIGGHAYISALSFLFISSKQARICHKSKKTLALGPWFRGPQNFGSKEKFHNFCKHYICIFVLVQRTFFYYVANKRSLKKNEREGLKWMTMSILFLWRWELVIVTYNTWNKTSESIFQKTRGQSGTQ